LLVQRSVIPYGASSLKNHSLFITLKSLTGNPRGCVYTEPLWGIPFNLYAPYISIYMVALGVSDTHIGLIVSLSWAFQVVFALLSGVITDKIGRRRTTLLFDILSWSVPALISALAQNFWYFLAAGIINSTWRITMNSWTCLLVEDAEQNQLVDIYTWISISNQLVGFMAPLAGVIIGIFSLVPTMRALYAFAAVMFTLKPIVTYWMTQETAQGKVRMHETRAQSVFDLLREYTQVVRDLFHAPQTLYTAGITLVLSITTLISANFWAILVTEKLHIPAQDLGAFPFVKSAIILGFYFVVMPRITKMHYKLPMVIGFLGYIASQVLLISAPDQGYRLLIVSAFLEACSFALISPLVGEMTVLTIDPKERARIQSILYVGVILFTSPFGWIAGTLSGLNKDLPFILNIVLFTIGAALAYLAGQASQKRLAAQYPV
ncbi:MAG TPA: MFS transporter, partial [Roseiflexaceae bacterium]|nr:MFS transporter [Roseiflexaceae bacterium]